MQPCFSGRNRDRVEAEGRAQMQDLVRKRARLTHEATRRVVATL